MKDTNVNYISQYSDNVLKLQRRKRTKKTKTRFSIKKPDTEAHNAMKNSQFRSVAIALKFGCVMNEESEKFHDPDLEIDQSYIGLLQNYETGIEKFTKLVLMVIRMIRVIKAFSKNATDTGRPVLVGELEKERVTVPQHPAFFNPNVYKLRAFQYHIDSEAREVLQLPWINRTPGQVHRVWTALRHLKQFRNMTLTMQHTMAKYARYENHGKNRTIVRKGDPGRHYYFIYSGRVTLMNSNVETNDDCPTLGAGQDFGHVALLHMEKRTATLMCSENTEFVVLDRRGNGRAVFRTLHMEHKRKRKFLKTLDMFAGLSELEYRSLSDHGRISEFLPMALVATATNNHPFIYIIMDGIANVCLKTDVYSCCIPDSVHREFVAKTAAKRRCQHKADPLHDIFTQHDPTVTVVIQRLTQGHIFGAQHLLHNKTPLPDLHLIAQSKLTVLTLPVYSVLHYMKPQGVSRMQIRYPIYPSIKELMKEYMESSIWDLYKAYIIRDLLHFNGRVDPSKRCKYCLSCQLRSLMLPNILPDTLREEVSDLYCPGNISPLPSLACQTFRPKSAPPSIRDRLVRQTTLRCHTTSPNRSPDLRCSGPPTPDIHVSTHVSISPKPPTRCPRIEPPPRPKTPCNIITQVRSYMTSPDNDSICYNETAVQLRRKSSGFSWPSRDS